MSETTLEQPIRIDVITLFPELVTAVVEHGIPSRAVNKGLLEVKTWNPRQFTHDNHHTVDDRSYGGGPGMVMKYEPLRDSIRAVREDRPDKPIVVYLSPQGQPITQAKLRDLATTSGVVLLAGRYEGIDERVIDACVDEEWSLGDFVLSGGEMAAMVVIDAVARLLPGALGDEQSAEQDSFGIEGLLDCPHYTRPEEIDGLKVPDVLLGGNHAHIMRWRRQQMLGRTAQRRPDLLPADLDDTDRDLLAQYQQVMNQKSSKRD